MPRRSAPPRTKIAYWSRLFDWRNQTLTPNPDVVYLMPFIDTTTTGPMVLEIPPADGGAVNGSVMNAWQAPIEDVGPAGVDEGRGGRYLILPPGYSDGVPDGYIPMPSDTFEVYALLRALLRSASDDDVATAVAYAKQIRLHPLSAAGDPPETVFVDLHGQLFDSAIPYDRRFFEVLDEVVQREPWLERDRVMIDHLSSIGIRKGHAFEPDERLAGLLDEAAGEAHEWLDARYRELNVPFADGARWAVPIEPAYLRATADGFSGPDAYPIDARAVPFHFGFFSARHLGTGQFYLMSISDAPGNPLDGGRRYTLTVPADPPVEAFWSATAYDRETHTLIRDTPWSSRSSGTPGLRTDGDGSVTLTFGPERPDDGDVNWIPTRAGADFEVLFRFYQPTPALREKTWTLPDLIPS
ncbi:MULTISPECIES: DUF1254 domain-containing protein [unclassified Agromyces]|uniref:DUF1254 domain-containing protein n=1 Tax=unclassified Agromyces TaxID=2639701 RepID=UPI0030141F28